MSIQRLLPALAVLMLFFGITGLALSQGQVVVTVLPTPTPMAVPPSSDQISVAALPPDLIVTNIETQPATPLVGQSTRILVTISNQGAANVSCNPPNNFNTDLYVDPPVDPFVNYHQIIDPALGLPWGVQCFWTPAGGSYVLETTWVFTDVGTFDVWAQADSDGNVVETNEDNNSKKISVSAVTANSFVQETHQDFSTYMASTLENDDPTGKLRLSRFQEPPLFERWFTDSFCEITPASMSISDVNITSPDLRINPVTTENQMAPQLFANGQGVVVAVWEDWRNGPVNNRDIYLRYSTDEGKTWQPEIMVNDNLPDTNQTNPAVALSQNGTMMVAWQDNRNGNWDVYAQEFKLNGSFARVGSNFIIGGAASYNARDQIFPDVAVDEAGGFHFAWEDKRNGNSDIFATSYVTRSNVLTWTNVRRIDDGTGTTQQTRPTLEALDWLKVTGLDYTVAPVEPYTVTINSVISEPITVLVATWEDDRNGATDIAMTASIDDGETYDIDQLLTNNPGDGNQQKPDVTLTKDTTTLKVAIPLPDGSEHQEEIDVPVSDIHVAWEGYTTPNNLDRDIYYSKSRLNVAQHGNQNQFDLVLSVGSPEKINQNDSRNWQTGPVDQSSPALTSAPCAGQSADATDYNVFIAWADGRNYDDLNYDIYYDLKSTCGASLGGNQLLADGVSLHNFDTTNPSYADYDSGHPPPGTQSNPSIAADIKFEGSTVSGGYLYLAWEDDRIGDPHQNKDIYFARSNLTYYNQTPYGFPDGAGSHISNILDTGDTNTTWYALAWDVTTPESTYVTVQTRLGNTITDVLNSDWYPQDFPFQPQPGACNNVYDDAFDSGAPLPGYDAPGQHIVDSTGAFWPQARYIQYRVNFYTRDETKTPELDSLTLYYDNQSSIAGSDNYTYLPIIMR